MTEKQPQLEITPEKEKILRKINEVIDDMEKQFLRDEFGDMTEVREPGMPDFDDAKERINR